MSWTREQLFDFLSEEPRIGRLATVSPSGRPHVVPVWFRVDGDWILVHTMADSRKARNVQSSGRFALTVDVDDWPYKGVTIQGSAKGVGPDVIDFAPIVERIAVDYLGEDVGGPMGRYMVQLPAEHVILVLEPETWKGFDYS
ncbi:MAG: TIGR03618 family F420-dependent PPOX class oxidoreductase [Acidimicrobiia bacterium]